MNFVKPSRDRKKIAQIKNQLRGQHRYRDLLLFVVVTFFFIYITGGLIGATFGWLPLF